MPNIDDVGKGGWGLKISSLATPPSKCPGTALIVSKIKMHYIILLTKSQNDHQQYCKNIYFISQTFGN